MIAFEIHVHLRQWPPFLANIWDKTIFSLFESSKKNFDQIDTDTSSLLILFVKMTEKKITIKCLLFVLIYLKSWMKKVTMSSVRLETFFLWKWNQEKEVDTDSEKKRYKNSISFFCINTWSHKSLESSEKTSDIRHQVHMDASILI